MNFEIEKCKIMIMNFMLNGNNEISSLVLGRELEEVEEFKYLGIKINKHGLGNGKLK